jgi:hypothetical protein
VTDAIILSQRVVRVVSCRRGDSPLQNPHQRSSNRPLI